MRLLSVDTLVGTTVGAAVTGIAVAIYHGDPERGLAVAAVGWICTLAISAAIRLIVNQRTL